MKRIVLIWALFYITSAAHSQKSGEWNSYIRQSGLYYSSPNITMAGAGIGAGVGINFHKNLLAQADLNIYWINGNAFSAQLSAGYKKSGTWSPALFINTSVLWGSGTEILLDDGSRPANIINAVGLEVAPLRFENEKGFVSALELGYGIGRYQGKYIEFTLLKIGIKF